MDLSETLPQAIWFVNAGGCLRFTTGSTGLEPVLKSTSPGWGWLEVNVVETRERKPLALGLDCSLMTFFKVRNRYIQEVSDSLSGGILKPISFIIAPEFNHSTALEMETQVKS
jgi:hypothetical protein